jgi:hypothetical protein
MSNPGGTTWEGKVRGAHPSVLRIEWSVEGARRWARRGDLLGRWPAARRRPAGRGRREVAGAGAAMISQCISWDSVHGAADATTFRYTEWPGPEGALMADARIAGRPSAREINHNRGKFVPHYIIWPGDRLGTRRVCNTRKVIWMERHERLTLCTAGRDCRQSGPDHFGYPGGWSGAGGFETKELAATTIPRAGETHQCTASSRPRSYTPSAKL